MKNNFVVSNSSPLMNLSIIGQLELLKQLFGKIFIPNEVWQELIIDGKNKKGSVLIRNSSWIKKISINNLELCKSLNKDLDIGEAAAITLAIEKNASLILLDETDARHIADIYDLKKTGVIGVLMRAKKNKFINEIKPYLDALKQEANFWIKQKLYETILSEMKE